MLKKHFVSFYSPGSFSCEFITEEIDRWDVKKACERAKALKKECGMTPELSQYYWIKQWDGKLPTTMLGDSTTTMMNMGEMK